MAKEYFYVTNFNFNRIIANSKIDIEFQLDRVYKTIYEICSLDKYLNHKEAKLLCKKILFLELSDERLVEWEEEARLRASEKKSFLSSSNLLFVSSPKFHKDASCETLQSDFQNYRVPEEIRQRGPEEISRFRQFAYDNRKLIGEGREDVFLMRIAQEFRLGQELGKISMPNSGAASHRKLGDLTLDEVEKRIAALLDSIEKMRESPEGNRAITSYIYSPTPNRLLSTNENLTDTERAVLQAKSELLELVLYYHVLKHKSGSISFDISLLKLFGFEKCGKCLRDKAAAHF